MGTTAHHRVLIVGGGAAGISVAARLIKKGYTDVGIIEPSDKHHYQPLWTLVGGGHVKREVSERDEASVMPKQATWIKDAASAFDPEAKTVTTAKGDAYGYDALIVCPGIQLDWDRTPGLKDAVGKNGVSSNYTYDLAPKTWEFIQNTRSGTAVFTMPSGPIKCAGAPQRLPTWLLTIGARKGSSTRSTSISCFRHRACLG
ncbi:MAG: FAD/NAD(P)-binding oxidoreductase [Acidimicrobiales bacterium]